MTGKENTVILLIRHAESVPSPKAAEAEWPLSKLGFQQAAWLAESLKDVSVDAVVSSPYLRAIETVRPLATQLKISIEKIADLRERKLCEGMRDDWFELVQKAWTDFSFALPGAESGAECQQRMKDCLKNLAKQYSGKVIAAASHGNAIELFLNALDPSFVFKNWRKMRNPDVFWITYPKNGAPVWQKSFQFSLKC